MWYNKINRTTEVQVLEAIEVARKAVEAASDKQAVDIVLLDVRGVCSFADYFVICNGESTRQIQAIYDEIEKLKNESVTEAELNKAKRRAKAGLIRQLDSNSGLAIELAFYEVITGDWRNLFRQLDKINKVTAEDIQRVAKEYFTKKNRTVGLIETAVSEN